MAFSVAPRLLWPRCCKKERVALPRKLAVVKCGQLVPTLLMSKGGMFKFGIKEYESIQGIKYDQMISLNLKHCAHRVLHTDPHLGKDLADLWFETHIKHTICLQSALVSLG